MNVNKNEQLHFHHHPTALMTIALFLFASLVAPVTAQQTNTQTKNELTGNTKFLNSLSIFSV